ncbi:hypothetical protein [Streptoalloteichus hindustanus]|uniref:Uncharacterized protein n=1 Tax=Streptoalloteichus hindustanus TaxID=2017 RepID=A0A1M5PX97_STRHI|nr:hypothetical protein [Streptoalloteichus hindustanus]SHH06161.1 hypothetical protein SAMN05444320_12027 [Streptoalloteichus hindustanus]
MASDDRELLLSRDPDKRALSEKMHRLGFGSYYDFPEKVPVIRSSEVPAAHWKDPVGDNTNGYGVVGNWKVMSYYRGIPTYVGDPVFNDTPDDASMTVGGSRTISSEYTFGIEYSAEASFFDLVKASTTYSFSASWSESTTFTQTMTVTIRPGWVSWIEVSPVARVLDGDFIYLRAESGTRKIGRFSGVIEAPGIEGNLKDVYTLRSTPMTEALVSHVQSLASQSDSGVRAVGDGGLRFSADLLPADLRAGAERHDTDL